MCMSRLIHLIICPASPIHRIILILLEGINNTITGRIHKRSHMVRKSHQKRHFH